MKDELSISEGLNMAGLSMRSGNKLPLGLSPTKLSLFNLSQTLYVYSLCLHVLLQMLLQIVRSKINDPLCS